MEADDPAKAQERHNEQERQERGERERRRRAAKVAAEKAELNQDEAQDDNDEALLRHSSKVRRGRTATAATDTDDATSCPPSVSLPSTGRPTRR